MDFPRFGGHPVKPFEDRRRSVLRQASNNSLNEGTKSVPQVAKELGITGDQIYKWRREFAADGYAAFPGNGKMNSHDEEVHRLRRELKRVI